MKKFAIFLCLFLSACGIGETGSGVVYRGSSTIPCPGPATLSPEVVAEFQKYADNPLMMQFYKHYLDQQRQLAAYQQHNPTVPNCPVAFWVENGVAEQFRQYPSGHPMREFFKNYAEQQREIDAHYTPNSTRSM